MNFVASLTISPGDLRKLLQLWDDFDNGRDPFCSVLVSPLFTSPTTMQIVREELKEKRGSEVYFDSGGFFVQQGKMRYEELYRALRDFYLKSENQWADWYVLPDHVPTSADSKINVERKVRDTVSCSKLFFAELPAHLQERALPVIQGHTAEQVLFCIDEYVKLGFRRLGFGSFGTTGLNQSVNRLTCESLNMLVYVHDCAERYGFHTHLFGVTTPPAIWIFGAFGVDSFDSLGWNITANFGNVYLPYTQAFNICHRGTKQTALSREAFELRKLRTEHECQFCEDFAKLQTNYHYRRLHNLICLKETAERKRTKQASALVKECMPEYLRGLIRRVRWGKYHPFM